LCDAWDEPKTQAFDVVARNDTEVFVETAEIEQQRKRKDHELRSLKNF
jgi:hypothetical protein